MLPLEDQGLGNAIPGDRCNAGRALCAKPGGQLRIIK
jgi:hypothetical protein